MIQVGDTFKSKDGRVNTLYVVTKVDETDNATYICSFLILHSFISVT